MGARSLPAFTVTRSWAGTKLFSWKHIHGIHKRPTVCYRLFLSCMLFKQRDGQKGKNLKYTPLQRSKLNRGEKNTTKENWKGRNQMCSSHWKRQGIWFYHLFNFYFTFCDLWEEKKRPVITVAFMVRGQHDGTTVQAEQRAGRFVTTHLFPHLNLWNTGGILALIQNLQDGNLAHTCIIKKKKQKNPKDIWLGFFLTWGKACRIRPQVYKFFLQTHISFTLQLLSPR